MVNTNLKLCTSPTSKICQQKQQEILTGLKGVEVIANGILVYENTEQALIDRNRNLEARLEENVMKVKRMWNCQNVNDVRRFLGLETYLGRFLPDLSRIAQPLRLLIHNNAK